MDASARYRATDGTVVTFAQIEQEFKKARIVGGHSTSGEAYQAALAEWVSTYTRMSDSDLRREAAPLKVFFVSLGVTMLVAFLAGLLGGPAGFFIVFGLGFVGSLGIVFWVTLFTMPKPKPSGKQVPPDFRPGRLG